MTAVLLLRVKRFGGHLGGHLIALFRANSHAPAMLPGATLLQAAVGQSILPVCPAYTRVLGGPTLGDLLTVELLRIPYTRLSGRRIAPAQLAWFARGQERGCSPKYA
jgi:hypothetical protein